MNINTWTVRVRDAVKGLWPTSCRGVHVPRESNAPWACTVNAFLHFYQFSVGTQKVSSVGKWIEKKAERITTKCFQASESFKTKILSIVYQLEITSLSCVKILIIYLILTRSTEEISHAMNYYYYLGSHAITYCRLDWEDEKYLILHYKANAKVGTNSYFQRFPGGS